MQIAEGSKLADFEVESLSARQLRELASEYYWYHSIDLGKGVITPGDYDMREYLDFYRFPSDMSGMKVLDVGRGSGFFSFEFERRGAEVTATEIGSFFDWDFVGGEAERDRRLAEIGDVEGYTRRHITGAFDFAHMALASKVIPKTVNVYNISPTTVGGPFDLIFMGSLTSHLRDCMRAFERLRNVIRPGGLCIIASPSIDMSPHEAFALAVLVGPTGDPDRRSWWIFNKRCLIEMLQCAGFGKAEIVAEFVLPLARTGAACPHIVAHATA